MFPGLAATLLMTLLMTLLSVAPTAAAPPVAVELEQVLAELRTVDPRTEPQRARQLDGRAAGLAVKAYLGGDCQAADTVLQRGYENFRMCWDHLGCRKNIQQSPEARHLYIETAGMHAACRAAAGDEAAAREVFQFALQVSRGTGQVPVHAHDLAARMLEWKGRGGEVLRKLVDDEVAHNQLVQTEMAQERYPDPTQLSALQIVGLLVARIQAPPRDEAARTLELARQALAQAERASSGLALRDPLVRQREASAGLLLALPPAIRAHLALGQDEAARPLARRLDELEKGFRSGPISHPIGAESWLLRDRYPDLFLTEEQDRQIEAGWKSLFRGPGKSGSGKSGPAPAASAAPPAASPTRKLTLQERVKALKARHR